MSVTASTTTTGASICSRLCMIRHRRHCSRTFPIRYSSDSKPSRGFGRQPKSNKAKKVTISRQEQDEILEKRKRFTEQSGTINRAPGLSAQTEGKPSKIAMDVQFEERLQAVKRSAVELKKIDESKEYGAINYDSPVEPDRNTIGLGTKIGIGVAIVVFGLVFALGDFLPTGSDGPTEKASVVDNKLSEEEKQNLQTRLQKYETMLTASPEDPTALEGTAVTLAELGDYTRAASLLEDLTKKKSDDPDAFRLLGEVKYELRDYEGSAAAYRRSIMVSKTVNVEVLRGLTNALLAAKKPDEAVQFLLDYHKHLNTEKANDHDANSDGSMSETESEVVDSVQVELLLGKAYSDWGHVSDALSVYDRLISSHPDDFHGYLAKGILLKENGGVGEAERMFIQARFFAPKKAKALVDRYSRQ